MYDPLNPTRDPITRCQRGCCWNPFTCSTKRKCDCHTADPKLPTQEAPISKHYYHDPVPGQAISRIERRARTRVRTRQ